MWTRVQGCLHSDPDRESSWTCGGPTRERVLDHGMQADDGSAAKFAVHAKLLIHSERVCSIAMNRMPRYP